MPAFMCVHAFKCVYHMHAGACRGQKRHWLPWNWSYKWLATVWVVRIKHGSPEEQLSSAERSSALTYHYF